MADIAIYSADTMPNVSYTAVSKPAVRDRHKHLKPFKDTRQGIKPLPAAFDQQYVKRLQGTNVKRGKTKRELAEQLREDIRQFRRASGVDRLVIIWAASTEVFLTPGAEHQTLAAFEKAMDQNDHAIAPSM